LDHYTKLQLLGKLGTWNVWMWILTDIFTVTMFFIQPFRNLGWSESNPIFLNEYFCFNHVKHLKACFTAYLYSLGAAVRIVSMVRYYPCSYFSSGASFIFYSCLLKKLKYIWEEFCNVRLLTRSADCLYLANQRKCADIKRNRAIDNEQTLLQNDWL
jgi:hypothetical protein